MEYEIRIGRTRITFIQGDITKQETGAIVNAANSSLMGGGGVDGAIHRAGGPEILEECEKIVNKCGPCPPGHSVITSGGKLRASYVVHTVGPVWHGGGRKEPKILASAYRKSLETARNMGVNSLSFPSISTGAYAYPVDKAARVAIRAVADFVREEPFGEVRFVLFSESDFHTYKAAAEEFAGR